MILRPPLPAALTFLGNPLFQRLHVADLDTGKSLTFPNTGDSLAVFPLFSQTFKLEVEILLGAWFCRNDF